MRARTGVATEKYGLTTSEIERASEYWQSGNRDWRQAARVLGLVEFEQGVRQLFRALKRKARETPHEAEAAAQDQRGRDSLQRQGSADHRSGGDEEDEREAPKLRHIDVFPYIPRHQQEAEEDKKECKWELWILVGGGILFIIWYVLCAILSNTSPASK